jgi:hypothetical protein
VVFGEMRYVLRILGTVRLDVRSWIRGFGTLFAITLFFCLIQSAHDGIMKRNRNFDSQRWWYPIYKILMM